MLLTQSLRFLLVAAAGLGDDWPGFRGPGARGIASGAPPPATFDVETGEHLRWVEPIPGLAHSSPVVWGQRLFLTSAVRVAGDAELSSLYGSEGYGAGEPVADEGAHRFVVRCLDKRTGALLWQRTAVAGTPRFPRHPKATHANATPAVDGQRVVACFGSEGLVAYDHDGQELWRVDLGALEVGAPGHHESLPWGYGSSPTLHAGVVYVQCDQEGDSFLLAIDAATGEERWRAAREEESSTWCTPTVHVGPERAQVIANGYQVIAGYALDSGEELWRLVGGGDVPVPTPVVADGLVFLTSAHGPSRPLRAVPTGARGLLVREDLAWSQPRAGVYMQTPLVLEGLVYACSDGGVLGVYDARTGERVYRERLGDGTAGFTASPVASGERIWWVAEDGEVVCVRRGAQLEVLGRSELGETSLATPAISEGVLYVRGRSRLFAVGE